MDQMSKIEQMPRVESWDRHSDGDLKVGERPIQQKEFWVQLHNEMIKGFWWVTEASVPADNVAGETRNIFFLSLFS